MTRPSQRPAFNAHNRLIRTLTLSSLLLAPALSCSLAHAQSEAPPQGAIGARPDVGVRAMAPDTLFTRATSMYDEALKDHVNEAGLLDYSKLKGNDNLAAFVAALPGVDVSRFPAFPTKAAPEDSDAAPSRTPKADKSNKNKKANSEPSVDRSWELAFWINAHNALAIKTLADAYPLSSPDQVKDFGTRKFAVAGGQYTLAEIRARASKIDPRATFAMTDGTVSGPKMAPHAMRAYGLNDTLESSVSALVNDPKLVELMRIQNRVAVPQFLAFADELWKPRISTRKWDGIRYLLSAYTSASPDRNYYTTNRYDVVFAPADRRINVVPPVFGG